MTENLAKVSVIIPAFNAENFIGDAINSALKQHYDNLEIIVVNDCSTDNTLKVLSEFGNKIRIINNTQNSGASFSRNAGIKAATGEFIAFLDADDVWLANKLNQQLAALAQHPESEFVYTDSPLIDINNNGFDFEQVDPKQPEIECKSLANVFEKPYFSTSTIILTRSLCQQIGFFREDLNTAEDVDFCLKAASLTTVIKLNQALAITRRVAGSLGSSPDSYQDNLSVIDDFLARHNEFQCTHKKLVVQVKRKIYLDWLKELIYQRKTNKALALMREIKARYLTWSFVPLALKALILSIISLVKSK